MFAPVKNHKVLNLLGILGIWFSFIITVTFNGLAGSGSSDIFNSNVGNLSRKYELSITPAGYTFSIWSIIYIWNAAAFVFYLFSIFSSSAMGKLYLNPVVISPWYSFFFISNLWYNTAWIFTWDREELVGSSILLFLIAQTNIVSLALLAKNIAQDGHQMREEKPKIYWTYVVLSMNGQGIYATWTIIASLLNFCHCLVYVAKVDMEVACNICSGILLGVMIIYFLLENTVLDNYVRLLMTPYLVVIWAATGIIVEKDGEKDVAQSNKRMTKAILGIACVFMTLRILIVVLRQLKRPLGRS
eukprot:12615.XXX_631717_632741_1 [CDS] Oithona nana genome sequencing.